MKRMICICLAVLMLLSVLPVVASASTPADIGWTNATGNYSGWTVSNDGTTLTAERDKLNQTNLWKNLITDTDNFCVSVTLRADADASGYVRVLGQTVEMDGRGGHGDQLCIKESGQTYPWITTKDYTVTLKFKREGGGILSAVISSAADTQTFRMSAAELNSNVEIGVYAGTVSFSDITVTAPTEDSTEGTWQVYAPANGNYVLSDDGKSLTVNSWDGKAKWSTPLPCDTGFVLDFDVKINARNAFDVVIFTNNDSQRWLFSRLQAFPDGFYTCTSYWTRENTWDVKFEGSGASTANKVHNQISFNRATGIFRWVLTEAETGTVIRDTSFDIASVEDPTFFDGELIFQIGGEQGGSAEFSNVSVTAQPYQYGWTPDPAEGWRFFSENDFAVNTTQAATAQIAKELISDPTTFALSGTFTVPHGTCAVCTVLGQKIELDARSANNDQIYAVIDGAGEWVPTKSQTAKLELSRKDGELTVDVTGSGTASLHKTVPAEKLTDDQTVCIGYYRAENIPDGTGINISGLTVRNLPDPGDYGIEATADMNANWTLFDAGNSAWNYFIDNTDDSLTMEDWTGSAKWEQAMNGETSWTLEFDTAFQPTANCVLYFKTPAGTNDALFSGTRQSFMRYQYKPDGSVFFSLEFWTAKETWDSKINCTVKGVNNPKLHTVFTLNKLSRTLTWELYNVGKTILYGSKSFSIDSVDAPAFFEHPSLYLLAGGEGAGRATFCNVKITQGDSGFPLAISGTHTIVINEQMHYTAITDADTRLTAFDWQLFLDGAPVAQSAAAEFDYSFTQPGVYTLVLTATDAEGNQASRSFQIRVVEHNGSGKDKRAIPFYTGAFVTEKGEETWKRELCEEISYYQGDAMAMTYAAPGDDVKADLIFVEYGEKDLLAGTPTDTFAAKLADCIAKLRAENPQAVIVTVGIGGIKYTDKVTPERHADYNRILRAETERQKGLFADVYAFTAIEARNMTYAVHRKNAVLDILGLYASALTISSGTPNYLSYLETPAVTDSDFAAALSKLKGADTPAAVKELLLSGKTGVYMHTFMTLSDELQQKVIGRLLAADRSSLASREDVQTLFDRCQYAALSEGVPQLETRTIGRLVAVGDSLVSSSNEAAFKYVTVLGDLISEAQGSPCEVINEGIGGTRLTCATEKGFASGLDGVDNTIKCHDPDLVILGFGVNDIQHLNMDPKELIKYEEQYYQLVKAACPDAILLRPSMPYLVQDAHGEALEEYDELLRALDDKYGIIYFEVRTEHYGSDFLTYDGAHPNQIGDRMAANVVFATLCRYLDLIGETACTHENTELRNANPASCTEDGFTGDTYCLDCGELLSAGSVIPALGHDYVNGICARCGADDPIFTPKDPCEGYTDINRNGWYHAAADFVIESGLMGSTKTEELTFEPNTKVSRAMVASILYRIAGNGETPAYQGTFTDVKAGKWYTVAIEWCAKNGLASGKGDGTFDPNGNVTRQELAVFFYNLAKFRGYDMTTLASLDSFPDAAKVPSWAKTALSWCVARSVISGKGVGNEIYLMPADTAMRSELASILYHFPEK